MKHLGDITKINGATVPPVNVVIGGSPCQDLSVAGRREGLKGERSGLFMEQIRIIKGMRAKSEQNGTTDIKPRYMVWENVPGAFSSNKGHDFKAVLEETIGVVEKVKPDIPIPDGGWHYSGAIMGNGFSVAWRVFDAQFWGVPQRRRRIALVADFGGATAPEILFECESVSGDITQSGTPWKEFAAIIAKRFNSSNRRERIADFDTVPLNTMVCTRQANEIKNGLGVGKINDPQFTILAGHEHAVAYDARDNGDGDTVPTITGDHENRITDYTALCVRERCGCDGGGKGCLVQKDQSGALATNNDQFVCALDRAAFNQGINAQYDPEISESGINSTLTAKGASAVCMATQQGGAEIRTDGKAPTLTVAAGMSGNNQPVYTNAEYTVRRLTPLECERLQGFPGGWTDIGDYIDSKGKKRKTSDSARYKALGNSIALPSWVWVLERLARCCGSDYTMASLFDGIGGFPLIWETLNGEGTCLWASEIEEFPIAVTKYHFNNHH